MHFQKGQNSEKAKISVNVDGQFYTNAPDLILKIMDKNDGIRITGNNKDGNNKAFSDNLEYLEAKLWMAWTESYNPTVTTENVIHYNIESHVSFAETEDGVILPNEYFEGAKWTRNVDEMYGEHNASSWSEGGYSLVVGAMAKTKTTTTYGESSKTDFSLFYNGDDHMGHDNPASLLNSWCAFNFRNEYGEDEYKEIPYTDEAAMFFYNLMLGMANLSRQIQEATFDEKKLLQLITSNTNLLEFKK